MENLIEQIDQAFAELRLATVAHTNALTVKMLAKQKFESMYGVGVYQGAYSGKNETERMGSFRCEFPEILQDIDDSELSELEARCNLTLAKLAVKRLEMITRSMELSDEETD